MNLHIENLAKIGVADIKLDGITVIVGDNNTGKSTIGKALWAMFDALSNLEEKAKNERINKCSQFLYDYPYRMINLKLNHIPSVRNIAESLINHEISIENFINELEQKANKKLATEDVFSEIDSLKKRLQDLLDIKDNELQSQIVMDVFNSIFNGQITSYFHPQQKTIIMMKIKGIELSVEINKGLPTVINKLTLRNNPYLFDDPSQLELLNPPYNIYSFNSVEFLPNPINSTLKQRIAESYIKTTQENNAIDTIILRNKMNSINQLFDNVMDGQVQYIEKKGFQYITSKFKQPLQLNNLSQGIKSFALLQAAFSHGAIKDRDVLILDEPEIHLHPDWQIKYAELVVLLQKAFNLTVLLTTHSPDFAQAIRLYSQKHGLSGELNAYISKEQKDGTVTMKEVPKETWDPVFETFTDSFDKLMALRSELRRARNEK